MFSERRDPWMTFIVCSCIGAFIFIDTSGYPSVQTQGFGYGPAFYPRVLAGVLIGLGMLVLFQDWRHGTGPHRLSEDRAGAPARPVRVMYRSVAVFLFLCVVSIMAMEYIGFLVSGFFLVFVSTLLIRASFTVREVALTFLYCAGMMGLVYVVFNVFVGVQMPGSVFFR